jgi:hypothetical protein
MSPAFGNFELDKGYDIDAAVLIYRAVKLSANPESVTPVVATTDRTHGISQFGVTTAEIAKGKGCSVRLEGITEWEAGGVIAKGAEVMADASGRCITRAAGAGNVVCGVALQAASGAGVRIPVQLYVSKPVL